MSEILLGGGPAMPTGVTASDGDYANKVGVHWDAIRGATLYRIFRNTVDNSSAATDIGSTKANYFFDPTAIVNQQYFYWVRAENGGIVSSLSDPDTGFRAAGMITQGLFTPLEPPIAPAGNELTAAKAFLGKTLFWDEQMSSTRTVACGTCHRPGAGGADPRTLEDLSGSLNAGPDGVFDTPDDIFGSPGVPANYANGTFGLNAISGFLPQVTNRRSPSYLNSGYSPNGLFWDGRASDTFRDQLSGIVILPIRGSLESQSAGPPANSAEMAHSGRNWNDIAARIRGSRPLAVALNIPPALERWIGGRNY
ncbi:MAG: cytochrome-c peroxidase, partial [Pyrinomonadaceae bacterium]